MSCAVYIILLSLCLTLLFFLIVLFLESKISSYYTSLSVNSLICYYSLITKLDCRDLIICSCKECISYNLIYYVSKNSSKCNECTYTSS